MEPAGVEAFLIKKAANIRYLSGFTSGEDAWLLVDGAGLTLFTDGRYREQAARESPDCTYEEYSGDSLDRLGTFGLKYRKLAFEAEEISYRDYLRLSALLAERLQPAGSWIDDLRLVKDARECELLRRSAAVSIGAFNELLAEIAPGMRERDIAARLEYLLKKAGAEDLAFPSIVVSGPNAALPHGKPSERVLLSGDMLTLDWGGKTDGYVSDMTRTLVLGTATPRLQSLYAQVLEAQLTGLEAVKAGAATVEIDAKVRQVLAKYDLAAYFVHGTGHGIGLEIHEAPTVSPRGGTYLQENMVITIEPGVYLPGYGGIRIEDSVIVTAAGAEIITPLTKQLTII
jgi:Xaa-Pro aminopeptidase/Xaa-Pro dipeptidase